MDPLTHTLVGANLATTRLGGKTRLATAALVIGANLPDVDSILYFTGHDDLALHFRRGWTHGVLALVVLPLLLTGLLLVWDRLRPGERKADPRWLLILSFGAILTHPLLDWLNNYGMRWLMPFRGTWFYGDSVFIMDPYLWVLLGAGWLATRRPTVGMLLVFAVCVTLLGRVVAGRSTEYLGVLVVVVVILLAAMLWRPAPETARRFAAASFALAIGYIAARLVIHEWTEKRVERALSLEGPVQKLMVAPRPLDPLSWDVVAQLPEGYRYGWYSWTGGAGLVLEPERIPLPVESPEWRAARSDPTVRGYVNWVRFPWYDVERRDDGTFVRLYDARYMVRRSGRGFGGVEVKIE